MIEPVEHIWGHVGLYDRARNVRETAELLQEQQNENDLGRKGCHIALADHNKYKA